MESHRNDRDTHNIKTPTWKHLIHETHPHCSRIILKSSWRAVSLRSALTALLLVPLGSNAAETAHRGRAAGFARCRAQPGANRRGDFPRSELHARGNPDALRADEGDRADGGPDVHHLGPRRTPAGRVAVRALRSGLRRGGGQRDFRADDALPGRSAGMDAANAVLSQQAGAQHAGTARAGAEYLRRVVSRYKDHPAQGPWSLANEPAGLAASSSTGPRCGSSASGCGGSTVRWSG